MSDFPTKENPKLCDNGCGCKIYLSNKSGRYLPYELDGTVHVCPKKQSNGKLADSSTNTTQKEETKFTQNDVNVLEHLLSKMKLMVDKK